MTDSEIGEVMRVDTLERLAGVISTHCVAVGTHATPIPGLYLSKAVSTSTSPQTVDRAVLCVVAQGEKSIVLNRRVYPFSAGQYLVIPLDLPLVGQLIRASKHSPCLSLTIELDIPELTSLMTETTFLKPTPRTQPQAFAIKPLNDELLNGVIRLVNLLNRPEEIKVLAPLLLREIFYRLLLSTDNTLMLRVTNQQAQMGRIALGVAFLKRNFSRTVRMSELAREVRMSPRRMHVWFKAATGMTPGQFVKSFRLQEARRIMIFETLDVNTACRRVGYVSASQFSRDYLRHFGVPPARDVKAIRANNQLLVGRSAQMI